MLNKLIKSIPDRLLALNQRWVYVVAFLLTIPGLFMGPLMDDYPQYLVFHGLDWFASTWDLFYFAPGDPEQLIPDIATGPYPWWTLPELKLHFFRPLSSATMALDNWLFGATWWPRSLHSALWYLAFIFAWSRVLKALSAGRWGTLSLWFTAFFVGNATPALWVANRNAVISATFALLAFAAHLEWRENNKRWGLPLSLFALALAFSAGEIALGVCGYIGAYELVGATGTLKSRIKHLLPATLVSLAYLLFYKSMGYGTFGSGAYVDPFGDATQFLTLAPGRMLSLLGQIILTVPTEPQAMIEGYVWVNWIAGAIAIVFFATLVKVLWQHLDPPQKRHIPWLAIGSVIALIPVSATMSSGRLLLLAALGLQACIAAFILAGSKSIQHKLPLKLSLLTLLFMHLVAAPFSFLGTGYVFGNLARASRDAFLNSEIDLPDIQNKKIILLAGPDFITNFYPPFIWVYAGYKLPETWWVIAGDPHDHTITPLDAHRIRVESLGGEMLLHPLEQLFRGQHFPFQAGMTVPLNGAKLTVTKMGDLGPKVVEVTFDLPIEDPSHLFLFWSEGTLKPLHLPKTGESITLPWSMGAAGLGL